MVEAYVDQFSLEKLTILQAIFDHFADSAFWVMMQSLHQESAVFLLDVCKMVNCS